MSEPSLCPDCGRNAEFLLHAEGCPTFGREVEEFIRKHEAEIAAWPPGARAALDHLAAMQGVLFGKTLRARMTIGRLEKALRFYANPEDWSEITASTDIHFASNVVREGEPLMVFEPGEEQPWKVAAAALTEGGTHE